MRTSAKALASLLVAVAAAVLLVACGGDNKKEFKVDDPAPDNDRFHVAADATRFGGPVPLSVKMYSTPYHAKGKVHWRWRFDDGTTSEEQNPVHTFKHPGYYQVLMEARDAKGADAWNLIFGAWPPKVWEAGKPSGPNIATTLKKVQRQQNARTGARRRAQLVQARKRAAQYSTGAKPQT